MHNPRTTKARTTCAIASRLHRTRDTSIASSVKMRELRGAGMVTVELVPTEINPADIFTKILSRQVFDRHRKTVLYLTG